MRRASFMVAGLVLLAGCTSIVGADFDRPAAGSREPAVVDGAAGGTPKNVVPAGPGGTCSPDRKLCGAGCAQNDDAAYGCGASDCTPCPVPAHATSTCSAKLSCDFVCEPGFERADAACVGWSIERTDVSSLTAIGGAPGGDVFVGSSFEAPQTTGRVVRSATFGGWSDESSDALNGRSILAIRGLPTGELFAATTGASFTATTIGGGETAPLMIRMPGGSWVAESVGDPAPWNILDVCPISNEEVFVASSAGIRHLAHGQWTTEKGDVGRLWAADASNVYAISTLPMIYRREPNAKWQALPSANRAPLYGIWGSGANDIYVVGAHGTVLHSGGGVGWTLEHTETTENLRAIWGSGPDDIYAVGDHGTIVHSVGAGEWKAQTSTTREDLAGVWGRGRDAVYSAGGSVILSRRGSR